MSDKDKETGSAVTQARKDAKLTQHDAADIAGISPKTLSSLEKGEQTTSATKFRVFAALNIHPDKTIAMTMDEALSKPTIGARLEAARIIRGLTTTELAKRSKVARPTIAAIISNTIKDPRSLAALADTLGLTEDDLKGAQHPFNPEDVTGTTVGQRTTSARTLRNLTKTDLLKLLQQYDPSISYEDLFRLEQHNDHTISPSIIATALDIDLATLEPTNSPQLSDLATATMTLTSTTQSTIEDLASTLDIPHAHIMELLSLPHGDNPSPQALTALSRLIGHTATLSTQSNAPQTRKTVNIPVHALAIAQSEPEESYISPNAPIGTLRVLPHYANHVALRMPADTVNPLHTSKDIIVIDIDGTPQLEDRVITQLTDDTYFIGILEQLDQHAATLYTGTEPSKKIPHTKILQIFKIVQIQYS